MTITNRRLFDSFTKSGAIVHADTVNADSQGTTPNEETKASVDTHEVDVSGSVAAVSNNSNAAGLLGLGKRRKQND